VLAGDGKTAERRAQDTALAAFAERLAKEQRDLSVRADSIVRALGFGLARPSGGSEFLDTHERAARDLRQLSGTEFDRRFLEHVTEALGRAVAMLDEAATTGGNGPVAKLLQDARTKTRRQLEDATRLRDGMRPT
jgi:predicted outer membrane protein